MDGIVEQLLRLEQAKHRALIQCDSAAYETHVNAQLHLLDSTPDLAESALRFPKALITLAKLVRRNSRLMLNMLVGSRVFVASHGGYTSTGDRELGPLSRFRTRG